LLISTEDWDNVLGDNNVKIKHINHLIAQLNNLFFFRLKILLDNLKSIPKKKLKEWITQGLVVSIRNINNLSIKLQKRDFDRYFKLSYRFSL